MWLIKSGYDPAPAQAEPSTYSLPDQPINHCYAPAHVWTAKDSNIYTPHDNSNVVPSNQLGNKTSHNNTTQNLY